ncbi:MAG: 3-oxoacyl-ACP synthase, partial [Moorella sp. (in: Bacteria)]|nr:3-oxoacyl-ACP synthase [Moorella sp. (in: firmicutes)]
MEAFMVAWQYLQTVREESALALVVVADAPGAMAADNVEHGLGAGAVAFILTREAPVAVIEGMASVVQDFLGERYRRAGDTNLHDLGVREYTGETFLDLGQHTVQNLLKQLGRSPGDYQYFIAGQHDARLPQTLGRRLGFEEEKIKPALLYPQTGDTGAASVFLSLAHILASAYEGEKILLLSYGSGAKALALSLEVSVEISSFRPVHPVSYWLERKKYLDYIRYLKERRQIV